MRREYALAHGLHINPNAISEMGFPSVLQAASVAKSELHWVSRATYRPDGVVCGGKDARAGRPRARHSQLIHSAGLSAGMRALCSGPACGRNSSS